MAPTKYFALVVTPWVGDGTFDSPMRARLLDDHFVDRCIDETHQLPENITPDPNEHTVSVIIDEDVLLAVERDPMYEVLFAELVQDPSPGL